MITVINIRVLGVGVTKHPPPTHTHTFLGNNLEKLNFKHGIQNQKNQQIKRKYGMIEAKMIFFLLSLLKA
jgi:hypothetical protein